MNYRVVLVEPHYEENLGLIARAMKNFGLKELILVKPVADFKSEKAKSRAMHAQNLLKKAKKVNSLEKALKGTELAIATTAILGGRQNIQRAALTPKKFAEQYAGFQKKIALIFGREPTGLTNEEIALCDLIVHVPSSKDYGTLNLSHSAAILFYELFQARKKSGGKKPAPKNIRKKIEQEFWQGIKDSKKIKNKKDVSRSLKALLTKSLLTEKEAKAVLSSLKALREKK